MGDRLSPELEELSLLALEHGFNSISDSEGPLVPFSIIEGPDGRELHRFVVGDFELELSLEAAQQSIASSRPRLSRYAIAWDGYVTEPGRRTDAILVEAGERGTAVLLAQCYGPLEPTRRGSSSEPALVSP